MRQRKFKEKKRHWFATGYFGFSIILNLVLFIGFVVLWFNPTPENDVWNSAMYSAVSFLLVVSYLALFAWKKWGIYTFLLAIILRLAIGLFEGITIAESLTPIYGAVILCAFIFLGSERKIWPQLD